MTLSDQSSLSPHFQPVGKTTHRRRPRSLSQNVIQNLTNMIQSGELKTGAKLPTEAEIMEREGVSRTVVREAISHLQASGLVETRHGIGTFVLNTPKSAFKIDPATITTIGDLLALLELRISLETETAGLAALRRSDLQLEAIRQALGKFDQDREAGLDTVASDFDFHLQIVIASNNRYFIDIMHHLGAGVIPRKRVDTAQFAHRPQNSYLQQVSAEHQAIFEAIRVQDEEGARNAMRLHLSASRDRLQIAHQAAQAASGPTGN